MGYAIVYYDTRMKTKQLLVTLYLHQKKHKISSLILMGLITWQIMWSSTWCFPSLNWKYILSKKIFSLLLEDSGSLANDFFSKFAVGLDFVKFLWKITWQKRKNGEQSSFFFFVLVTLHGSLSANLIFLIRSVLLFSNITLFKHRWLMICCCQGHVSIFVRICYCNGKPLWQRIGSEQWVVSFGKKKLKSRFILLFDQIYV